MTYQHNYNEQEQEQKVKVGSILGILKLEAYLCNSVSLAIQFMVQFNKTMGFVYQTLKCKPSTQQLLLAFIQRTCPCQK